MRALTVQQPWAWAIVHGGKDIENRTQAWSYRGQLAIHAGKRISTRGVAVVAELSEPPLFPWPSNVDPTGVYGAIIGVVDLVNVHWCYGDPSDETACCAPWGEVEYVEHGGRVRSRIAHLELENPRPLTNPIPAKGRLGLWAPDPDLLAQIREQVAS